ncbi:hypothetical protein LIER_17562 [Lithospermum erythrorhizon]|uniref:Uncharacterized protein n=1 Tax=Lithospermum erythrorhizon TaxID=34254 RepID=A0AAV3QF66_LITER
MAVRLFNEVVPIAECLSRSLSEEARLPASSEFLLSGYHYLATQSLDGRVSASTWVSFWNHSLRSYVGYEASDRSTSKSIYPHKLPMIEHRPWDAVGRHPLDTLRVSAGLEEEVYCGPFFFLLVMCVCFACLASGFYLCGFFKMASFMENGSRVSLAPPFIVTKGSY